MNTASIDVSCIIPVFNGERYVREAIISVLDQTAGAPEVVVVDDGSTDSTAEQVSGFGSRVRYLRQPNAGPTRARNLGLSVANGHFLGFLDADDLWCPDKLARQMELFAQDPQLDYCVTGVENFVEGPTDGSVLGRSRAVAGFSAITLLARRAAFERVGPFRAELEHAADTDWFLRAAELGLTCRLLLEPLVRRRLHGRNRSHEHTRRSQREYLALIKAHLDRKRARAAERLTP